MKLVVSFATALCLLTAATVQSSSQTPAFNDPANLRGERVSPRDGRELPIDQGARGLEQLLRRLNTRASLMLIVAHPDDEDGGMLTFYSRGMGARVAMLTLNRGEGGQNAMTGDFEDALGLLRTQELLSADRYFGVNQMFGTEVDFGFSKTKEETFAKWTHERVLYDAVRAVRLYRPLVVASVFIGGVTDGHGHHQVSGEITQEVFKAAADPKVFPDQIAEGLLPWAPLKVYARVPMQAITSQGLFDYATGQYAPARFTNYVTGEVTTTTPSADVVVHEGNKDKLLEDKSYVQFARIGLGLQKSQIGNGMRMPPAGAFDIGYHRYGSRLDAAHQKAHEDSFFEGIDTSIEGIASLAPGAPPLLRSGLAKLGASIAFATSRFDAANPSAIAPQLADALQQDDTLLSTLEATSFGDADEKASVLHELRVKRVQINDALAIALGLTLDATTSGADQTAGSAVVVLAQLRTAVSTAPLSVTHEWLQSGEASTPTPSSLTQHELEEQSQRYFSGTGNVRPEVPGHESIPDLTLDRPITRSLHATPRDTMSPTRPYFFRDSIETPVYSLHNPDLRNAPVDPPALTAWATVSFRGAAVQLGRIVHDGSQPLNLIPAYSLSLSAHAQVVPRAESKVALTASLSASSAPQKAMTLPVSIGNHLLHTQIAQVAVPGQADFHFVLSSAMPVSTTLDAAVTSAGVKYSEGYRTIGYGDLPRTNYFTPASDRLVPVDLNLPAHRRIAYLPGTGDDVPEALASIGFKPEMLAVSDLTADRLKDFDTVILGVRTYNAHPDLHGAPTQALLDFARNGGNVIVQYQTYEFTEADAPYPLTLDGSAEKVIDETAPVRLLDARAPLLTTPNRIEPADFDHWIEERGHGFLGNWDKHYTPVTETHDPGQEPQRGGLVTTQLGKGHWTYCAFALYRQLPEAVPGSYRLFANMLGLADQK
jgi:LmbE family N-acetylglucosaminyl deacetylase